MKNMNRSIAAIGGCVILTSAGCVFAQDWPPWRGLNWDGKVSMFTASQKWLKELTQKWKTMVGLGDATPALVGEKFYVFRWQGVDKGTLCLNAGDGKESWKNKYAAQAVAGAAGGAAETRQPTDASPTTKAVVSCAEPTPPDEKVGSRPYEMVWADRKPDRRPLLSFGTLEGWTVHCTDGARATLYPSNEQRVWDSKTAKLMYRGTSQKSTVILRPPTAIPIDRPFDCVNLWLFGNNWQWVPDATTPQVHISLLLKNEAGVEREIYLTRVRWKEWWLVHRRLDDKTIQELESGCRFSGLKITHCANVEDRVLFFEDLVFYKESSAPLRFAPRPKRGIDPFPGQSTGANVGPGRLPFPTRETTILPTNLARKFRNQVTRNENGSFRFAYAGPDATLEYVLQPGEQNLGRVDVVLNEDVVATALRDAGVELDPLISTTRLSEASLKDGVVRLTWNNGVESHLRIWQKSLVVDFFCRGGKATKLRYGRITGVAKPEIIRLPYMNYHGHHLGVLVVRGSQPCFASIWMDWYRSNASRPFARDEITTDGVFLNGGVDYLARTDGVRNDLYERFFFTVSPTFEETLATIPNPPATHGRQAGRWLWQESWGPRNYETEMQRSRKLRAYGIEMLTQCNHEITWRDGGESFTFRDRAAPGKGGDEALKAFIKHQRSLGWRSGLYSNYCDFAPVNGMWNEDWVMHDPKGDWVRAWPRCYSPKALAAVQADAELAPKIHDKFGTNAAYTDVHTSVSPWSRTDYDARVPGAGTFAATFYAYGELLLHDQKVYDGFCWSEGNHQWLYAGLATGNYALAYSDLRLWDYPYLPHFDLLKIHPLEVDIGMPWTGQFFNQCEGWQKPDRIEASIDKFIAATIAYGHIGWLVEESHGIRHACRSYYMLQQLQSRYVMREPETIQYGTDEGLISSSRALLNGAWRDSRLFVLYPDALRVWVNGNDKKPWTVDVEGTTVTLSPSGWAAIQGDVFFEESALEDGHRIDRIVSPAYVYVDGRGRETTCAGVRTAGAVAVRSSNRGKGLSVVAVDGTGAFSIRKPTGRHTHGAVCDVIRAVAEAAALDVVAFDVESRSLGAPPVERKQDAWVVSAVPKGIRYEIGIR